MEVIPTKLAGNAEQDKPKYPYVAWFIILAFVFWLIYVTIRDGYEDENDVTSTNVLPVEKEPNQVKKYLTLESVFYSVLTALVILAIARFGWIV
nr:putative membrane protein [Cedratvirus duvanny]